MEELRRLRAIVNQGPGDPGTRIAYEARFKTRSVIATGADGRVYTAAVIGFLPFCRVLIQDMQGLAHTVNLDSLTEDVGRVVI